MYEQEIHEALDKQDLQKVFNLMFQRTAWIQSNPPLTPDEARRLMEETKHIQERLEQVQENVMEQLKDTRKRQHAMRKYSTWGG
jgi:hypothetical protein